MCDDALVAAVSNLLNGPNAAALTTVSSVRKAVEAQLGVDLKALGLKPRVKELVLAHYAAGAAEEAVGEVEEAEGASEPESEEELGPFLTPRYAKAYVEAQTASHDADSVRSFWGTIAWVKVGAYPWWACYVCDPTQLCNKTHTTLVKKGITTHAVPIFLGDSMAFNAPVKVTAKTFRHWDEFQAEGRAAADAAKTKFRADALSAIEHADREMGVAPEFRCLSTRRDWSHAFHASEMRFVALAAEDDRSVVGAKVTIDFGAAAAAAASASSYTLAATFSVGGAQPVLVRKRGHDPGKDSSLYCVTDMTSSGAGLVDADLGAAKVGMGGPHHVWVDIKAEGVAVSVERPVFPMLRTKKKKKKKKAKKTPTKKARAKKKAARSDDAESADEGSDADAAVAPTKLRLTAPKPSSARGTGSYTASLAATMGLGSRGQTSVSLADAYADESSDDLSAESSSEEEGEGGASSFSQKPRRKRKSSAARARKVGPVEAKGVKKQRSLEKVVEFVATLPPPAYLSKERKRGRSTSTSGARTQRRKKKAKQVVRVDPRALPEKSARAAAQLPQLRRVLQHLIPEGREGPEEIEAGDFKLLQKVMRRLHGMQGVTLALIVSTKAAPVVKALRKHRNAKVAKMAMMVFTAWKKRFEAEATATAAKKRQQANP